MAEIDPVVLELRAEVGKYRADLKSTTSLVSQSLGQQEKSVQRLEAQMRRSSGAIGGQIKGLAAAFAGAFTGRELVGLIDGFTRLQNSLRVAGLEGQNLERVQSQLLELSSKYGVGIEGLADLFGKTSQTANELGASQQQLIQLTEASSQALKITGTSAQQAQGALLGLTQALASGKVRAEEFNQINEGGLRPLLQVIANTERFGGSVAKLRQAVNDGKVSSQEFFQAILGGAQELDAKASRATLTLAGAYEALSSRLIVYVGSAASAQGVTGALASALGVLADNLDSVIPALALVITAVGVRYVAAAASAAAASVALSAAATGTAASMGLLGASTFALQARLAGAATSMEAAAFAARGLWGALAGPAGIAIAVTAVVTGLGYLFTRLEQTSEAHKRAEEAAQAQADAQNFAADISDKLTRATENQRRVTIAALKAAREKAAEDLRAAKAALERAKAEITLARAIAQRRLDTVSVDVATGVPTLATTPAGSDQQLAEADPRYAALYKSYTRLQDNTRRLEAQIAKLDAGISAAGAPVKLEPLGKPEKSKKEAKPPKDRTDDILARSSQELAQLQIEELRARQQITTNAEERANIEAEILAIERKQRERDIEDAKKSAISDGVDPKVAEDIAQAQRDILDSLYGKRDAEAQGEELAVKGVKSLYRQANERELQARLVSQQTDAMRDELDLLSAQANATDVREARVAIERRMLEIQQKIERALLEEAIARGDVLDAAKARASLEQRQSIERSNFDRSSGGPLQQYLRDLEKAGANVNDQFQQIAVDGLQSFTDGISDAIVNAKNLGDVFKNVAKQIIADLIRIAIQQQIVAAFGGGSGGGDGGLFSAIGSIFGRASGGYVAPGQVVRVNESRGGAEYLRMGSQGGTVIPLGQVNQQVAQPSSGTGVVRVIIEEGPNFMSTIRTEATGVSLEVTRASAPTIIDAAANETLRRANRPKV